MNKSWFCLPFVGVSKKKDLPVLLYLVLKRKKIKLYSVNLLKTLINKLRNWVIVEHQFLVLFKYVQVFPMYFGFCVFVPQSGHWLVQKIMQPQKVGIWRKSLPVIPAPNNNKLDIQTKVLPNFFVTRFVAASVCKSQTDSLQRTWTGTDHLQG